MFTFQEWLGRRFARAAFDDSVNEDVLGPAATALRGYLSKARDSREAAKTPSASGQFMLCVEEWLVGGSEKLISLNAVTSHASMAAVGLPKDAPEVVLESGRAFIEKQLRAKLPAGEGYGLELAIWTLDALPASRYRDMAPWTFDTAVDALIGC